MRTITAASSAASILGAPLMHDLVIVSLSDLMTPLDLIMKRVEMAAEGDFITCIYNPKSKTRTEYLEQARQILLKKRPATTPVGIVRNAGRVDQSSKVTTLGDLDPADVDMFCIVIVGNSQTYISNGRIITPRGYRIEE